MEVESQSERNERNERELQEKFDNSPFDDIKFFIEPNSTATVEELTVQALKMMDELIDFQDGKIDPEYKAEYTFSSED